MKHPIGPWPSLLVSMVAGVQLTQVGGTTDPNDSGTEPPDSTSVGTDTKVPVAHEGPPGRRDR